MRGGWPRPPQSATSLFHRESARGGDARRQTRVQEEEAERGTASYFAAYRPLENRYFTAFHANGAPGRFLPGKRASGQKYRLRAGC